jgi:ATP-dependent helicase/nuclease subunit A
MSKRVHKETPFLLKKDVLLQGIIDCYFEEVSGSKKTLVLLDYKTGALSKSDVAKLEQYKLQLELYKEALEQILGLEVSDAFIYAIDTGAQISLK